MNSNANLETFAAGIAEICRHTPLAADKKLRWTIITNPKAGGFTIASRWKKHSAGIAASLDKARANPLRADAAPSGASIAANASGTAPSQTAANRHGLVLTTGPGHAKRLIEAIAAEMSADAETFHLIIAAGGDGTGLEVMTALFAAPEGVRNRCAVLRLPMGTGNDGADAWELAAALEKIIGKADIVFTRGLELRTSTPGKGPFLAFNILSVGLDAFVTHNTNKIKGKLPGDSYKLWVGIAAVFYDKIYNVGPMYVKAFDEANNEVQSLHETVLLLAVGASGHRTYGSHNRILPDDRNVCVVRQMPTLRKLALKGQFHKGTHIDKPESNLFSAMRVEFHGAYPILAQMDGETVLLQKADYPCAIVLTDPAIPVLELAK